MNINPSSPVSISVVMCTYNGDKYLEQQIDSILCQTYPIHELIIQDDCSTDRTVTIIEAYQKRDPRVKLYINEAPLGFNYNFSSAFAAEQINGSILLGTCEKFRETRTIMSFVRTVKPRP